MRTFGLQPSAEPCAERGRTSLQHHVKRLSIGDAPRATVGRHPWVARCRPADRALVFAHRGGSALRPENTIAAFDRAVELGVDGIELDVHLARDGEVVVMHDATLDRTTDATGPVAALTSVELARVDAGYQFDPAGGHPFRGRTGGVPTLADVLMRHPHLPLIVELKGASARLGRAAVATARTAGALDRVCFASFSLETLRAARSEATEVVTSATTPEIRSALYKSWVHWPLGNPPYVAFQVPERSGRRRIVSPRFIRMAHAAGRLVQVWTVNDEPDMRRLIGWGVDAILTDRPDLAWSVIRSVPPRPGSIRESAGGAAAASDRSENPAR